MFKNSTIQSDHILTLNLIQFQFLFRIAEPTLNRGQKIIKHALTEVRMENKIKNKIIFVEFSCFSLPSNISIYKVKIKKQRTNTYGTPVLTLTSLKRHQFTINCCEQSAINFDKKMTTQIANQTILPRS